jgi:hypothetical protein
MFQVYVPNVLYISNVCCKYFYLDVAKLDRDVAYVRKFSVVFHMYVGVSS